MKELHLRMPAGLLDRLDVQQRKDGVATDRSDWLRRVVEKELTRLENRAARDLVMKPQLVNHLAEQSSHSAAEQSADSANAQSGNSATGVEGN